MPSLGRLGGTGRLLKVLLHLRQDCLVPGFAGCLGVPHATLERLSRVRQDERHADVPVGRSLASADTRRPYELPRRSPVESSDVDADAELLTLTIAMNCAT